MTHLLQITMRYVFVLVAILTFCAGCDRKNEAKTPDDNEEIAQLAAEIWDYQLRSDLYNRMRLGLRIEEFKDITLQEAEQDAQVASRFLERLSGISPTSLSHESQLTRNYLINRLDQAVKAPRDYLYTFAITPYSGGYGFIYPLQYLAQAPLTEQSDRENYLKLLGEFADHIDQVREKTKYQAANGIYLPRPALPNAVGMISGYRDSATESLTPSAERLKDVDEIARTRFAKDIDSIVNSRVLPAYEGLLAALGEDYFSDAPTGVGISQYPGGAEAYARAINRHTSYTMTPKELHDLGLQKMSEISTRMASLRADIGFEGTQSEFHDLLAKDPRFVAASPEDVERRYESHIERIELVVGDYFSLMPKAPYGVKRLDPTQEPGQTFGYYQPPTPPEPRGLYRYNGSRLDDRSLIGAASLIYHELIPGHHFQIALQAENDKLPDIRKYSFASTAYIEGWAEYAASLGFEMGVYEDPYDAYGRLVLESFLVSRLVVDTGLNALGWSLDEARDYMSEHTMMSETEIATETLRYSTDWPGQALAYKTGHYNIDRLRKKSQDALGDGFKLKEFHAVVLETGALPLDLLEWHVNWYIQEKLAEN